MASNELNVFIGKLDRIISEAKCWVKVFRSLDEADQQTLDHHADDMVGMGQYMKHNIEQFRRLEPLHKEIGKQ